ncbi:MAG: DHH family phosphoesterase, partial [Marinilabiliales bacterium]
VKSCEALFCVDFNDVERAGNSADVIRKFGGASFLIDHHPVREQFTDFRICDVSYCATAELLFELAEKSKFAEYINREVAESLFTGILTDTGSFQHASSDPRIFINVGKLLSYGLNKDEIHEKVYDNYSSARMQLMGSALKDNMTILDDVNTAYITLSLAELKHYHYEPGDTEGFVNLPLSIKGIRFSVFFMERYDHIKLSLRSKGNFPANEFASKYYQGGGHKNAAGGRFYGTLEQAVENFEDNLNEYKKELTE